MGFLNINNINLPKQRDLSDLYSFYHSKDQIIRVINTLIQPIDFYNLDIILKPNWVRHPLNDLDNYCLITHHNIIYAVLEIILNYKPKSIILGDAPIQGCIWDKMISKEFYQKIDQYSKYYKVPITIKDFRRKIFDQNSNKVISNLRSLDEYVIFDLKENSYLEPISGVKPIFRVTQYNPDRLAISHTIGTHKYCIVRELFNSDIVITLPKVKTHQKTGITAALKNLVGVNGDKDFLPHHRVGGTGFGGDCYPGKNYIRRLSEYFLDRANKNIGNIRYKQYYTVAAILWKLNKTSPMHHLHAGWYGNDTSWRMVLDLNNIALYGKIDGTIDKSPQRVIYHLCDGIVGGQGDGPLFPEPLPLGIISFSDNASLTDAAMATLMGFDVNKIKLIKESNSIYPINNTSININGKSVSLSELSRYAIPTRPSPGWVENIEKVK